MGHREKPYTPQVQQPLTDAQRAVFAGHFERFSHPIKGADGLRDVYRCESLGMTRSLLHPRRVQRSAVTPKPYSVWFLDDDSTTYRSLGAVADAIMLRRKRAETRQQAAVLADTRCGQNLAAASAE